MSESRRFRLIEASGVFHCRELLLSSNQMSGTLPNSLGSLTALTVVALDTNSFNGTLPTTLQALVHVTSLDVSYNQLTGTLPATLQGMVGLRSLSICSNAFSGELTSSPFYGSAWLSALTTQSLTLSQCSIPIGSCQPGASPGVECTGTGRLGVKCIWKVETPS